MLVTTRSLDHHGIVSGIYDELEIGKVIDEVLPKFGQHKLAHSIVLKAMILNCLGFVDSRLYMDELGEEDKATVARARRLQRFMSQPLHVAENFTGTPGKYVKVEDTISSMTFISPC